jgi:endogenous inhibitor of DNA gyrase (YacG/DUF329 family)
MDTIYRKIADYLLTVHCPRCGFEARQKVLPLLQHKRACCPNCASLIDVNTALLEEKINALQARRKAQQAASPA